MSANGKTQQEMLVQISRAQRINRAMGGIVVLPWEVDQVPDEWLMAFEALSDRLPRLEHGMQQLDQAWERAKEKASGHAKNQSVRR